MSTETLDTKTLNTEDFYKNLRPEDRKPLKELVEVLKKYHSGGVFAVGKIVEQPHKEYKGINLLLRNVNKTGHSLSIDEIEDMGATIHTKNITINNKFRYESYVTDNTIVRIDYCKTKIKLFYTIGDIRMRPKISL